MKVFLKTAQPLRPGTRLCLELTLSDQGVVLLQGQVQWARKVPANLMRVAKKGGMGIRVLAITEGAEIFEKYCSNLQR